MDDTIQDDQKTKLISDLEARSSGIKPSRLPKRSKSPQDIVQQSVWQDPGTGHRYHVGKNGVEDLDKNVDVEIAKFQQNIISDLMKQKKSVTNSEGETSEMPVYTYDDAVGIAQTSARRAFPRFFPVQPQPSQGNGQLVNQGGQAIPNNGQVQINPQTGQPVRQAAAVQPTTTDKARLVKLNQKEAFLKNAILKVQRTPTNNDKLEPALTQALAKVQEAKAKIQPKIIKDQISTNMQSLQPAQKAQIETKIQELQSRMKKAEQAKDRDAWLQYQAELKKLLAMLAGANQ
jgi:hypothetical protein